jgi:hypothetical protein
LAFAYHDTDCIDPLDKFYAFRGLSRDGESLEVNYNHSLAWVFFNVAALHTPRERMDLDVPYLSFELLSSLPLSANDFLAACSSPSNSEILPWFKRIDQLYAAREDDYLDHEPGGQYQAVDPWPNRLKVSKVIDQMREDLVSADDSTYYGYETKTPSRVLLAKVSTGPAEMITSEQPVVDIHYMSEIFVQSVKSAQLSLLSKLPWAKDKYASLSTSAQEKVNETLNIFRSDSDLIDNLIRPMKENLAKPNRNSPISTYIRDMFHNSGLIATPEEQKDYQARNGDDDRYLGIRLNFKAFFALLLCMRYAPDIVGLPAWFAKYATDEARTARRRWVERIDKEAQDNAMQRPGQSASKETDSENDQIDDLDRSAIKSRRAALFQ